jgi:hypothetical protein
MGTEMDPVNSSTGMEWIRLVVVLLMVISFLVTKFLNHLPRMHIGELLFCDPSLPSPNGEGREGVIKKALPINQKSF